ncbi:MAG: hypothetical protein ABL956_04115 [Hyphomonadaceae bacterium]
MPQIDDVTVATMEIVGPESGRDMLGKVWRLFLGQAPDAVFTLDPLCAGGDPAAVAKQPLATVHLPVYRARTLCLKVRGYRARG